ncbi:Peptidase C15, pyroglutamyl peptidase I-like protein [Metarhizium album ARSEF 1941]|uniref:Peptidase C15, pyroglutamyl peptidase I-like protein n=1 Tax=Metarhizium album (strain ARSEF 1941) TaxID=1081103 RepID=A0A0B2WQX5_METAS|nr:Peptidase C15, pyroglutamyl peptidase I-like protein [Metarhizium album ARSEF 1941]KHN96413.1 Peptidase C15, pyroglutamyl peptidase I-like protein [Metarhizium album ARSEF 1941]
MGSQSKDQNELTVLVTAFGAFREQYPVNPSWEIAKGIPPHLTPLGAKDGGGGGSRDPPPRVRILVHPEPIRVNYKVVRDLVPGFWDTDYHGHKIDMAIHIGMAGPRPLYQIERRAHRRGYKTPDVDGELLADGPEGRPDDRDWIWYGLPDEILTEFDVDDVHKRWQAHSSVCLPPFPFFSTAFVGPASFGPTVSFLRVSLAVCSFVLFFFTRANARLVGGERGSEQKDMDLRVSEDPGRYLCDFIYYSSLAQLYKEKRPRKVVFLHVPSDSSEAFVTQGRELAINLIRALVESETAAQTGA